MTNDLQKRLDRATEGDTPAVVDALLDETVAAGASDLHLQPSPDGLRAMWRIDGVLRQALLVPPAVAANVVVRLKVLAGLLTYETHLPQEGRLPAGRLPLEVRVSTFPTIDGEKLVARLFDRGPDSQATLGSLGLQPASLATLRNTLLERSGAVVVAGPAGSGKTTTGYACLREVLSRSRGGRSVVSLEDPVEVVVPGVSQSEAAPAAGFGLATGLRSLLRQDPEVIFVGEVRDRETADVAFQAAMTGQLVLTTFHAPTAATAVERLLDMGVPSYTLRAALRAVLTQRLVRLLCGCAETDPAAAAFLATAGRRADQDPAPADEPPVEADDDGAVNANARRPVGCDRCGGSGYRGRRLLAYLSGGPNLLRETHASGVTGVAGASGLLRQALQLVRRGRTSVAEVLRVFGPGDCGELRYGVASQHAWRTPIGPDGPRQPDANVRGHE